MKTLRLSLIVLFVASASYLGAANNITAKFERQPPVIDISNIPEGLGKGAVNFTLGYSDIGAGISKLSVSLVQGATSQILHTEHRSDSPKNITVNISSDSLKNKYKEGSAQIVLQAEDASLWSNRVEKRVDIVLDFTAPTIAVVSNQHVASEGGAEFVLLEATDANLDSVIVTVDKHSFSAIPAVKFDAAFAGKNIYAALLALPIEMKANTSVTAVALDRVGNSSSAPINFAIKPFKRAKTSPKISSNFVNNKVGPLYREFLEKASSEQQVAKDSDSVAIFRTVNEDYRNYLQQQLASMPLSNNALSSGTFLKPMASATTSNFGESRSYSINGVQAGGSTHDGLDLASIKRDKVTATNTGSVLFAGPFGIYGNAVVIDHGMGLTSLYGHLSSISVQKNDSVTQGQEIGRSGETGLAGGDHLHFEFRIANIPVVPKEWWDAHWIADNIYGKISALKESLSIESQG